LRILITGAGGFIGQKVARALLARGGIADEPDAQPKLTALVLFDQTFPPDRVTDARVEYVTGDMLDGNLLARACVPQVDAVFHFASVVSAGAEADFDLGMRVNVDGMRNLLEICRAQRVPPRLVFPSSVAAFGGDLPEVVLDTTAPTPQSSYGTQKVIGELMVTDYTRKGFIDGRSLRLPTIVVRPGKPNRAASGFMSSCLREPLKGESTVCPVPAKTQMWIASPERAVDMLIHAMELPASVLGWNRTINGPGITVSVAEALAALERIAGSETVRRVRFEPDAAIAKIVLSWPVRFATVRADRLGFRRDADIDEIIHAHLQGRENNATGP
jgi:nucleoside-diphosphate-sugar epimerase